MKPAPAPRISIEAGSGAELGGGLWPPVLPEWPPLVLPELPPEWPPLLLLLEAVLLLTTLAFSSALVIEPVDFWAKLIAETPMTRLAMARPLKIADIRIVLLCQVGNSNFT